MIFSKTNIRCIYNTLNILQNRKSNYANLYRKLKVSHITLQTTLRLLLRNKLIIKKEKGHKKSHYEINNRGKDYLLLLEKLKTYENQPSPKDL